ncbi:MAG: heavy-metal-associated domain-containing protein [Chloroflexi bacterium]|nr:heavy-metal-associated domain-containing protein [Chloroflexota bacterium]
MTKVVLSVPAIDCEHCEHTVTTALNPLAGVQSVKVDIEAKLVHLEFDEGQLTLDQVKSVLEEEDYPVESVATFR